jgi:hypothetical protein
MSSLKGKERMAPNKMSRAQIQANQEQLAAEGKYKANDKSHLLSSFSIKDWSTCHSVCAPSQ